MPISRTLAKLLDKSHVTEHQISVAAGVIPEIVAEWRRGEHTRADRGVTAHLTHWTHALIRADKSPPPHGVTCRCKEQ